MALIDWIRGKMGLKRLLEAYCIPLEEWGVGSAKTLEHLEREIEEEETSLVPVGGELVRKVRGVSIAVRYGPYDLVEDRQEFPDGRVRHRHALGVSEKLKGEEDSLLAALRALREELGIEVSADSLTFLGQQTTTKASSSYPGLMSQYEMWDYEFEMPMEFFKEEYMEDNEGMRTYFKWVEAREYL